MELEFLQKLHNMNSGVSKFGEIENASIFGVSAGYLLVSLGILIAFQFILRLYQSGKYLKKGNPLTH